VGSGTKRLGEYLSQKVQFCWQQILLIFLRTKCNEKADIQLFIGPRRLPMKSYSSGALATIVPWKSAGDTN